MTTAPLDAEIDRRAAVSRTDVASQWQLMWWQFRRHKLALLSGVLVILFYLIAAFAELLAPFDPGKINPRYTYAPPQGLHFWNRDEAGGLRFGAFVHGYKVEIERQALRRVFVVDESKRIPVGFFVESDPYSLWGLFTVQTKLLGPIDKTQPMYLFGADRLGRDLFSRVIHGTRISMSIGLVGVVLSLFLGVLLGGLSGYYGGQIDNAIQRVIEFVLSIPTIPLWLGLAAAFPPDWPPLLTYFFITIILSLIGWTQLARVVRGRFLSLRTEDFVTAARLDGSGEMRIIFRHMVPSFVSHLIAAVSLAIPGMILAETSLSFLGLGLQPPIVSWGVLLQEAQSIRAVATAPWLFIPGGFVVLAVLALNFLGDGLRDAADPYGQ